MNQKAVKIFLFLLLGSCSSPIPETRAEQELLDPFLVLDVPW